MTNIYLKLPNKHLIGSPIVPGDKSISHRSLIFSSIANGKTTINGLLKSEDVLATANALRKWGINCQINENECVINGVGIEGLSASNDVIDCGNSGTSARLLMGLAASYNLTSFFTGDASLRKRPMNRIIDPLTQMGAKFTSAESGTLPIAVSGGNLEPIEYNMPIASAQVKSAILLAGINTKGTTTVIENTPSRDHSEKMLKFFGWNCQTEHTYNGGRKISIEGKQQVEEKEREIIIPGDPSSAAFPIVAALVTPGSEITLNNVGLNPLRTGLFNSLQEMGADITITNKRESGGEPIGDIKVKASKLKAVDIPAERAASMIDEYPILSVAAAYAEGTSRFRGLQELRVKESDRLTTMQNGLKACGVKAEIDSDDLIITGGIVSGNATIDSNHDHRIAMSFLILGLHSEKPIMVTGTETIASSFPSFFNEMEKLGVEIINNNKTPNKHLVIAIDGPAASGKGTLARRLADELKLKYLDTGSLYRAVGLKLTYNNKQPEDEAAALEAAQSIRLQDLRNPRLRQEHIGRAASIVSAMPEVRAALLDFQRKTAQMDNGAVLDGRDIGTVVCPDADFKFFITANVKTRAERRHRELSGQGVTVIYDSVLEDLIERDERDSKRKAAPLIAANNAITIDTSDIDADTVFNKVIDTIRQKLSA